MTPPRTDPPDFIFFECVGDMAMWVPGTASPLHISNTPLFPRVQRSAPPQTQPSARDRAGSERAAADPPPQPSIGPLLVCHDFKGGYLAYEKYQGMEGSETVYTCEYLHFIDTFVYFSHKRVAPPPASWINLMHKNGVRILGTFIVEGDSGTRDLHKIFQGGLDGADATFYANQLVLIAKTYGFDGWLLNFESNLPNSTFDLPILLKWLGYLKQEMHMAVPGGQIIWYDALTIDNRVKYQNGITDANKPFFDVSDGIFTNYWWREHNLHETAKIASALGRPRDVFSGVDVWGRGSLGNGGFNVGEALTLIQRYELAVALFAPGWTYEFLGADKFWENDRRFWVGGCYQQDSKGTAGTAYGPIAEYVSLQACGSSSFFYTNFNRGFGKGWKVRGQVKSSQPWVHLGAQSVLPTYTSTIGQRIHWNLDDKFSYSGGWCLAISGQTADEEFSSLSEGIFVCPLYKLELFVRKDTAMAVRYLLQGVQEFKEIGIYIDLQYLTTASLQRLRKYLAFDGSQAGHWHDLTVLSLLEGLQMKEVFDSSKIVELGVYCKCAVIDQRINIHPQSTETKQAPFVYLGEISISTGRFSPYKICSISTDITSSGRTRLSWKIAPHAGACTCDAPGPLSGATGPFAYFIVYSGGEWQGLAFATEFILSKSFIGDTDEVEYTVDGIMWDGTVVASC